MNEASTGQTVESFVMNLVYTGRNGSARAFVEVPLPQDATGYREEKEGFGK